MTIRALAALATALLTTGCLGAMSRPPENPVTAGGLTPVTEDEDAGLIGVAPGFELKRYTVIFVDRFTVPASLVRDADDQKAAVLFPVALQSELVTRLRATGLFDRVVNLSETQAPAGEYTALRLEGTVTKLDPGSRALRYMVGFGAGATKAQAETRLVDVQTGKVMVVTADRREAYFGIFGGDSEDHMREALSDMARDYARLMVRLKGAPVAATVPGAPALSSEASALVGTWRGTILFSERGIAGPPRDSSEYTARLDGETLQGAGIGADAVPQRFTL